MNPMPISTGAAACPTPKRRAASQPPTTATTRRLFSLAEAVRDLAGWTLPTHRPQPSQQPEGWQLA